MGAVDSNGNQSFDGKIDELIGFDPALSSAGVNEIKDCGIDGTKGGND